jgi:hypothetical protein
MVQVSQKFGVLSGQEVARTRNRFIEILGGGGGGGGATTGGTGGGGGGGSGPPVAQPSGPSPELQAFVATIPFANDGDVITPDHHNLLREALARIAGALDVSQFADVVTLSIPPAFQPIVDENPWRVTEGFSRGPTQTQDAKGWLPLNLPDGTSIDHVHVRGTAPTKPLQLNFTVVRKPLVNPNSDGDEIINADVQDKLAQGGGLDQSLRPKTDGTPTQLADLRHVDNSQYLYLLRATLVAPNANAASGVMVTLVEVTCVRG